MKRALYMAEEGVEEPKTAQARIRILHTGSVYDNLEVYTKNRIWYEYVSAAPEPIRHRKPFGVTDLAPAEPSKAAR